ncbi:hypothetical protein GCM10009868_15490 [Terrabacter aerolatus]|uniref:Uncharacterized protein n=1 Tax=Terrabacter aerolatus TaxID=422442 RepID=A0A512D3U8_9MICO|nr:hypothetical protein TAE01_29590 [Terrabacter aerolatus]
MLTPAPAADGADAAEPGTAAEAAKAVATVRSAAAEAVDVAMRRERRVPMEFLSGWVRPTPWFRVPGGHMVAAGVCEVDEFFLPVDCSFRVADVSVMCVYETRARVTYQTRADRWS